MRILNFISWFKLELMYISLIKSIRSNLIHLQFPAACAAANAHRNPVWNPICTDRINRLYLRTRSDRLLIIAKVFLNLVNLLMIIKQQNLSRTRLVSRTFCRIAKNVFRKVYLLLPLYLMVLRFLSFASDEAKLFIEI